MLDFLKSEDAVAARQPSLHTLLASSKRDYLISNNGDQHGTNIKVSADNEFINNNGVHFILNGSYYYANGFNTYWLMVVASDPSQRDKVSSLFQEAVSNNLTLARTWAFNDGGSQALQFSPGVYNEQMFQGYDNLMPVVSWDNHLRVTLTVS
ncbi:hypothetical protein AgCh_013023 [Apium graveolens]